MYKTTISCLNCGEGGREGGGKEGEEIIGNLVISGGPGSLVPHFYHGKVVAHLVQQGRRQVHRVGLFTTYACTYMYIHTYKFVARRVCLCVFSYRYR